MLLQEFKYETKQTKKQLILDYGVYIANRVKDQYILLLYQIDSFYAEVFYDYQEEQIGYIRTFNSTEELKPYLKNIDISPILSFC
jgi:hypothetical protein